MPLVLCCLNSVSLATSQLDTYLQLKGTQLEREMAAEIILRILDKVMQNAQSLNSQQVSASLPGCRDAGMLSVQSRINYAQCTPYSILPCTEKAERHNLYPAAIFNICQHGFPTQPGRLFITPETSSTPNTSNTSNWAKRWAHSRFYLACSWPVTGLQQFAYGHLSTRSPNRVRISKAAGELMSQPAW